MKNLSPRTHAAIILVQVIEKKRSLSQVLTNYLVEANEDESLIKEFCFGVLRWYHRLNCIAKSLLDKPLKETDTDVYCLILMGIYQLKSKRIPDHAALSKSVKGKESYQA